MDVQKKVRIKVTGVEPERHIEENEEIKIALELKQPEQKSEEEKREPIHEEKPLVSSALQARLDRIKEEFYEDKKKVALKIKDSGGKKQDMTSAESKTQVKAKEVPKRIKLVQSAREIAQGKQS